MSNFIEDIKKAGRFSKALGRSAKRIVNRQPISVSDEVAKERWEICKLCDEFVSNPKDSEKASCKVCGCAMHKKVHWASEWCWGGKWGVEDLVTLCIAAKEDELYLEVTVDVAKKNANGPVEILVGIDKDKEGLRVVYNRLAKKARGKYLMFMDAHCSLSEGWDVELREHCKEDTICYCHIDTLNPETWEISNREYNFYSLTLELETKWWEPYPGDDELKFVQESMSFTGCGWIIQKQTFDKLGGFIEELGGWGELGSEWALKLWLSGGKVLLVKAVVCAHWFRKNVVQNNVVENRRQLLKDIYYNMKGPNQIRSVEWLFKKFNSNLNKSSIKESSIMSSEELISVLIASRDEVYLQRTINCLRESAEGPLEILVGLDGPQKERGIEPAKEPYTQVQFHDVVGRRQIFNNLAYTAKGKYLFIIDAHCDMSQGWDTKLKEQCEDKTIVVSCLDGLNELTWKPHNIIHRQVYLNENLVEKWLSSNKLPDEVKNQTVQEMMGFTGCAWMITRNTYFYYKGYNTDMYYYGGDGPEWALKLWLSGGKVLLHTDVICYHLFRGEGSHSVKPPYSLDPKKIEETYNIICSLTAQKQWPRQTKDMSELFEYFEKYYGKDFSSDK